MTDKQTERKFHAMTDGEMVTLRFRNMFNITPEINAVLERMEIDINDLLSQTLQQERQRWIAELEGKKNPPIKTKKSDDYAIGKFNGFNRGIQTSIKVINGEKE